MARDRDFSATARICRFVGVGAGAGVMARAVMGSRGYGLAIAVVVATVLTQIGATVTGAILASRHLDHAALDTYGYVGDLTEERVARYSEAAHDVVAATAVQIGHAGEDLSHGLLVTSLFQRLDREPTVRAIYVGWPDGQYVVLRREGDRFVLLERTAGRAATAALYDQSFDYVGDAQTIGAYNPTQRPWYVDALGSGGLVWTEPYIEFNTTNTLVSAAQAARGDDGLIAVVGADLSLEPLTALLDDLPYGHGATAVVASPSGAVIAAPSEYAGIVQEFTAVHATVPTVGDLGLTVNADAANETAFSRVGSHIVFERALPVRENLDWVIHMEADESQLSSGLGGLDTTLWWITAVSLGMFVVAAVVAWRVRSPLSRLRERATTDQLTGLVNREEFLRRAGRVCAAAAARGDGVLLTAVDLDRFKELNDTRGHAVGDRALSVVGAALRARVRDGDVAARFGGDEFVTLQVLRSADDARGVVERLRADIEREVHTRIAGAEGVGVTMGFAQGHGELDVDALLRRADRALVIGKTVAKGAVYDAGDMDAGADTPC